MWTCKRCETLNEDERDSCALCSEPKVEKEEQQRISNRNNFSDDKQHFSQNQQSFGANNPQKEAEPRKKNHLAILIGVLCVLLLGAVIAIVVLINRQPVYQGAPQITEPPASPMETMAPQVTESPASPKETLGSQYDASQTVLKPVNKDHRIVIDSIIDPIFKQYFRWGAAIDQSGTIWIWNQNDGIAHTCDFSGATAIYTNGMDGSARLFVVKSDGSVWWTKLDWEKQALQYEFQKISGLQNIVDLEIINTFDIGLLALDDQGRVWAYGTGKYGVFGMGQDSIQLINPAVIEGIPPIQKIQCVYKDFEFGYGMVVAQATSGVFYYWGTNLFEKDSTEYTNIAKTINFDTNSPNWSLFESAYVARGVCFAWLDDEGFLSIYENKLQPTDYSELGSFIYQHGGLSGVYLLRTGGSVYAYGNYAAGAPFTGTYASARYPAMISELSDNKSIIAIALGRGETAAMYDDGRIGFWRESDNGDFRITDAKFIQDESGGDFKLMSSPTDTNAETENQYSVQCGNVTLTVESKCDYSVRIIPTNNILQESGAYYGGMSFDANRINVSLEECKILDANGFAIGTPLSGIRIRLTNLDTQQVWENKTTEDGTIESFESLPSGTYEYEISKDGFGTYTSPQFQLNYINGAENEYVWASYGLIANDSIFSNAFQLQLTDLDGNPVKSQDVGEITISSSADLKPPFRTWSTLTIGSMTDDQGIILPLSWTNVNSIAMQKGSVGIITINSTTVFRGADVADQYILIRAE